MTTAQLSLHTVTKRYGERTVLADVTLTVRPGEKAGVIGDNGSGKSTLLRLLAGRTGPDTGETTLATPGGLGYLPQSLDLLPRATVQDAVDAALAELRALEAELRRAESALAGAAPGAPLDGALAAYGRLVEEYETRDGYRADTRVDAALAGLGLPALARDRRLGTLSGGERSRLALAATLAARPEVLLLDEPTNDLDDGAVAWLEDHLRAHRGTVVAVTHDRLFLERLTTTVLEVDAGRVTRYGDGYDGYLAAKAAERARRLREYEEWRAELARSRRLAEAAATRLAAIPRSQPLAVFGHGAFRTRSRGHGAAGRIRNAKERVARLTANPVPPPPQPLVFRARPAVGAAAHREERGPGVPSADGGAAAQPGVVRDATPAAPPGAPDPAPAAELAGVVVGDRLRVPSLRLGAAGRLLVTGPNGAGKTTLLRVLAGELRPDSGVVRVPGRVGHLRQEETAWPPGATVLRAFAGDRPGTPDEHAARLLSYGLFRPADLRLRVRELSYGQRRRIDLARLIAEPVDLLLVDEPTNHLSPALVEELEQALAGYAGALVVVTHDRRMRAAFTGTRLELRAGTPQPPE
ncbi:ABC-F family ATP-binding cassette domain-containing protein [Streptomyces sp. WMMC500]|uniref:ABC-F family ATP-binding cassette domain-containing protein n=1 Tax=Streptomyces sp. WMMC500 TaxID=3015154 RepID=UPI00248D3AC4|nr:ABC-F family ATP-binding cassette domain-containing protein [Streptomyces sp. WMMC500]WBB61615.1 ABC-F family ATP-binding cassette domain-containing protein [Streptomyces sp. WMMC500]